MHARSLRIAALSLLIGSMAARADELSDFNAAVERAASHQRVAIAYLRTGNIDLAVTLCHLHGLKPAPTMVGRVMAELLRDGPAIDSVRVERTVQRVATDTANGRYEIEVHKSRVGATEYIGFTQTRRSGN